jgi:hypothetical protein
MTMPLSGKVTKTAENNCMRLKDVTVISLAEKTACGFDMRQRAVEVVMGG